MTNHNPKGSTTMPLDLNQLRALAELKRRQAALSDAVRAYEEAEKRCYQLGVSFRQIAVIAGESNTTLWRRYKRMAKREVAS